MFHLIMFGLLLGWGAAIPIGAINLEIIRRNLNLGTPKGLTLGLGACTADLTYLVLLSLGLLQILNYPFFIKVTGIVGSLFLAWFGWMAFKQIPNDKKEEGVIITNSSSLWKHWRDGYLLTLINPYNIIFWSSVSATIAVNMAFENAILYAGLGVLLGTISWVMGLNLFLHLTRHKISTKTVHRINMLGGLMLIGFAVLGLWHAIMN